VSDFEGVIAAAGRFWLAWTLATDGQNGMPPPEMVIEVHEAARQLIRAADAEDLPGALHVLDALVLEIKQANAALN
jgi:hypothetical protein